MTTVDIKLNVSDEVLAYLKREAGNRQLSVDAVVSAVLADYFDEPDEAEILGNIKRSMQQVLGGDYRPALDVLDEIEREMSEDGE